MRDTSGAADGRSGVDPERLSDLELSLTVLWNSVKRWMQQRSKASVIDGLSDLDVFLLHLIVYRDRPLRAIDLSFALSIDDRHLVAYSLKKLVRLHAITSSRLGKEVFYAAADRGKQHYREFLEDRARFLEPALRHLNYSNKELSGFGELVRALTGVYEQAARAAASAKGG